VLLGSTSFFPASFSASVGSGPFGKFNSWAILLEAASNTSKVTEPSPLASILAHVSFREASNCTGSLAISLYLSV
jgi:hypothetical protein